MISSHLKYKTLKRQLGNTLLSPSQGEMPKGQRGFIDLTRNSPSIITFST